MLRILLGVVAVIAVAGFAATYGSHTDKPIVAVNETATSSESVATSPAPDITARAAAVASSAAKAITEVMTSPADELKEGWKRAIATVFWVGEDATEDNEFIHNSSSAWDVDWEKHYGGVDDPFDRCGYRPCAFEPEENPFYVALPYNDLERGRRKENAIQIPWNDPSSQRKTVLKNRWIEVRAGETSCFGQWEDVGPYEEDDVDYVFGDAEYPWNEVGQQAAIDLSPALRDCLGVGDVAEVEWRHVEAEEVPDGPWTETITTRS